MSAPEGVADDIFDQFLTDRGHDVEPETWEPDYNKKRCPECGGLHETAAHRCTVCGWEPSG